MNAIRLAKDIGLGRRQLGERYHFVRITVYPRPLKARFAPSFRRAGKRPEKSNRKCVTISSDSSRRSTGFKNRGLDASILGKSHKE